MDVPIAHYGETTRGFIERGIGNIVEVLPTAALLVASKGAAGPAGSAKLGGMKIGSSTPCVGAQLRAVTTAPRGTGHYTGFDDEAAEIMRNAARSRGLNPNSGVRTMATLIREVDLSKLVPPPTRSFADPAKPQRLGPFDMSKYRPIQVEDLGGGRYMIMDGMTRAARRAGITKLPVQIFPKRGP